MQHERKWCLVQAGHGDLPQFVAEQKHKSKWYKFHFVIQYFIRELIKQAALKRSI